MDTQGSERGAELIDKLISLTGLPEAAMHEELGGILEQAGKDASTVTLEQLRHAMILYLEQLEKESLAAEAAGVDGSMAAPSPDSQ